MSFKFVWKRVQKVIIYQKHIAMKLVAAVTISFGGNALQVMQVM